MGSGWDGCRGPGAAQPGPGVSVAGGEDRGGRGGPGTGRGIRPCRPSWEKGDLRAGGGRERGGGRVVQGTSGWGRLCRPGGPGQRGSCGTGDIGPDSPCRVAVMVPRGCLWAGGPPNRGLFGLGTPALGQVCPEGGPNVGSAHPSLALAVPKARARCPSHPRLVPRVSRFSEASRAALPSPCCACCHGSVL